MKWIVRFSVLILALILGVGIATLALTAARAAAQMVDPLDLAVEIRAQEHVPPGSQFVVNVQYSNLGSELSPEDTWLYATLPPGASFITATDRWGAALPPDSLNGNLLGWHVGPLAPGSCCRHILITEEVAPNLPEETELVNAAEITSSANETNLANNSARVTSTVCDMGGSTKRVQAWQVKPGDVLTYTLHLALAARGPESQFRQVVLTDTLPPMHQVRFLGWSGTVSGTRDGNVLRWQGQVRAGEPLTLQYRLGVLGDVISGTVITNQARLSWGPGHMSLGPVTTVVTMPQYAHMFGPGGGAWQHQYGVGITVPPGAVSETTRFEFRPLFTGTQPVAGPPGWMFAHRAFELTAFRFGEQHQFGQPVTMTLSYGNDDVRGLNRETLRLWYRQGPAEPWAMLGDPVVSQPGKLTFTTNHLTEFALFGQGLYKVRLPLLLTR